MSKHKTIAIRGDDLWANVFNDSDGLWREVICYDPPGRHYAEFVDALDALAMMQDSTQAIIDERDRLDHKMRDDIANKWFVVSWPSHVLSPKYNSDADYGAPVTEADARADADAVYGEVGT